MERELLLQVRITRWDLEKVLKVELVRKHVCNWIQDYLKTNADLDREDRLLCDEIILTSTENK